MPNLLTQAGIHFGATASSKGEAVALCGGQFVNLGAASQEYADAMWEREQIASSYLGNAVAMPHGTNESRKYVNFGQIVLYVLQHHLSGMTKKSNSVLVSPHKVMST